MNFSRISLFITLVGIFFILGYFRLDPDFGWHLKSGEYFIEHGIPHHDVFTYTAPGFPWIAHAWLNDVALAGLYETSGYAGVSLFYALLAASALFVASRIYYPPAVLLAGLAFTPYVGIRSGIWTFLLFTALERLMHTKHKGALVLIPLLMLAWANLHGGFILGLAILLGIAVFKRRVDLALAGAAAFALTFINPYGADLYTEIGRTVSDITAKTRIVEWYPLFSITLIPVFVFIAFLFVALWEKYKGSITTKSFLNLPTILLLLALSGNRHIPLFTISVLRFFEPALKKLIDSSQKLHISHRITISKPIGVVVGVFAVIGYGGMMLNLSPDRERSYPAQAVAYLSERPCPGNVFNSYNYGGYLIWKLPGQKIFIDGRMTHWKTANGEYYFDQYEQIFSDSQYRNEVFARYNIQCVLIEQWVSARHETFRQDLENEGWYIPVSDEESILLVKR